MGGLFSSHFGLFGSSVLGLGTKRHRDLFSSQIDAFNWLGALAMTELGHGSNVNGIETEAHYDAATQEFIINTPTESAQKIWVGGATTHTRWCVVFAQLRLSAKNEGVHAFLVPIRNDDGSVSSNIRIADHGAKAGQNGVDSGRIWFDNKRVPRDMLLDRFAQVSADGTFSSAFRDPAQRFAATVSPLIFGRIAASTTANHVALLGLKIATRYSFSRTQFKAAPGSVNAGQEVPIISYMSQKRRLYPFMAASYAYLAAGNHVRRLYAKQQKKKEDWKMIHVLSAGIKAVSTWHKNEALQMSRECVGGQGFALVNRIVQLRSGTEIDLTVEGDNTVLLQQVSKQLLKKNGAEFWMREAANNSAASCGAVITAAGVKGMDNKSFLQAIFEWRVYLLLKLAKAKPDDSTLSASLALAFVDMISLHELFKIIDRTKEQERQNLQILLRLFVAFKLERDLGLILAYGGMSRDQAQRVLAWVSELCESVHPVALQLLEVPPVPDRIVRAPIAFNYVERHHYGRDLGQM